MKTATGIKVGGGVGKPSARLVGAVRGFFVWVWDRFDFWVIHRGRRLRSEVWAEIAREDEEERRGKNISSTCFHQH